MSGILSSALIAVFSIAVIWISKRLWLPKKCGKTQVRLYSLYIAFVVISSGLYPNWTEILLKYLQPLIKKTDIKILIDLTNGYSDLISFPPLLFAFFVIYLINRNLSNSDAMGKELESFDSVIPEPKFNERLAFTIAAFREDLRSINNQTNWTGSDYTDLEAEVFIKSKGGYKKKVSSLLRALKNKKGRAFLVLGEPGAGKSVALRTLALELLDEVQESNRIPIYVNLKEWSNTNWTETTPPTEEQLYQFVKENIARRDTAISRFVDKYFDRLYESRRLFFIFDSFDEIPQIMNVNDDSLLIDELSKVLYKFIKDNNNNSAGLVASRHFRKPTNSFNASSEIEIRPFKDVQIIESLNKTSNASEELINSIFTTRQDLYVSAKNPFMSSMIAKYIDIYNKLPDNQLQMFAVFIEDLLHNSKRKLSDLGITTDDVIYAAKDIALLMFSKFGLEAPIHELKNELKQHPIDKVIECLKFARLIRSSSSDTGRVSFVHRRFCEYFVVLDLLEKNKDVPFQDIPKDSQWRDALVLYCEVADIERATDIALRTWDIIKQDDGHANIEAIHCIRFLRDAFKGRIECVESIQQEIEDFISRELNETKIVYWNKFVIELLCLTRTKSIEKNVLSCLSFRDSWIFETAIESCRHLPNVSKHLIQKIGQYLNDESDSEFIKNFRSYRFNFSISNAFLPIKKYIKLRVLEYILLTSLFIYSSYVYPLYTLIFICFLILQSSISVIPERIGLLNKIETKNSLTKWLNKHPNKKENQPSTPTAIIDGGFTYYLTSTFNMIRGLFALVPILLIYLYIISLTPISSKIALSINLSNSMNLLNDFNSRVLFIAVYLYSLLPLIRLPVTTGTGLIKKDIRLFVIISCAVAFAVFMTIIFAFIKVVIYILIPIYAIALILILPRLFKKISSQLKYRKIYNKIKVSNIVSRENIYNALISLDGNITYTKKLLNKLEIEISNVSGEWPNTDILIKKNNAFASQLCQMDVRWKKMN